MGGIITSVIGGAISSSGSKKAAAAQSAAAAQDLAFQKETRDLIFDRLDPFYTPGITAQNALAYELGLGNKPMIGGQPQSIETFTDTMSMGQPAQAAMPYFGPGKTGEEARQRWQTQQALGLSMGQPAPQTRYRVGGQTFNTMDEAQAYANANPTGGTEYRGFQATPGYQFQFDQGTSAVNALAGARGGLNSGRTMQDLTTFGQGIANQEYSNYLARLTGMAGQGQAAAGAQANAATNAASGVSNALSGIGNAQSAGAIGQANAWTGAINNGLAAWQYQRGTGGGGGLNIGAPGSLFGGNSWG
jgi:hypothetical protein